MITVINKHVTILLINIKQNHINITQTLTQFLAFVNISIFNMQRKCNSKYSPLKSPNNAQIFRFKFRINNEALTICTIVINGQIEFPREITPFASPLSNHVSN